MTKFSVRTGLLLVVGMLAFGCARPGELGYDLAYSADERHKQIERNWDIEGKQLVEDFDHLLLLRPSSRLTYWNVR